MSKAVLALEMPEGCVNCALCRKENRKGYNDYICIPKKQLAPMAAGTDKPDWCPLMEMPKKSLRHWMMVRFAMDATMGGTIASKR